MPVDAAASSEFNSSVLSDSFLKDRYQVLILNILHSAQLPYQVSRDCSEYL